jgi:hypothetical protein
MLYEFDQEKEKRMDSYYQTIHPILQSKQFQYFVRLWLLLWRQIYWESIHQSLVHSRNQELNLELNDS